MLRSCAAPAVWPDPNALEPITPETGADHRMIDVGDLLRDPASGWRYLFKYGEDIGRAEAAAHELALRLDLNVPAAIVGKRETYKGALMRIVEGSVALEDHKDGQEYGKYPDDWLRELTGQSLMEYVTLDNDRHDGNYLIQNEALIGIDHGYALTSDAVEPHSASEYFARCGSWSVFALVMKNAPEALLSALSPADVRRYLRRLMSIPEHEFKDLIRHGTAWSGRSKVVKEASARRRVAPAEFGQLFTETIDKAQLVPKRWARWRSLPTFV